MKQRKPPLTERIMSVLRDRDMCVTDIATVLFVNRKDVRACVEQLRSNGRLFRRFFHNARTGRPDYHYTTVRPMPRCHFNAPMPQLLDVLGRWDVVDMTTIRR